MEEGFKNKCVEILKKSFVSDLPSVNVVELDSKADLYTSFSV
jgi:hypothetical protein